MNEFGNQMETIVDLFDPGESTIIRGSNEPVKDIQKSLARSFVNYFVNNSLPDGAKLNEDVELPYAFYKDTGKDSMVSRVSENETVTGTFRLNVNSVHDLLVKRAIKGVVRKIVPLPSSLDDKQVLTNEFMSVSEPSILTVVIPETDFLYHVGPAKNVFEEGYGLGYNRAVFGKELYNVLVKLTPKFAKKPAKFLKNKLSSCANKLTDLEKNPVYMVVTRYEKKIANYSLNNL